MSAGRSPGEERGPKRVYRNGAIEVHWEPHFCIHTGNCVRDLGRVVDRRIGFTTAPASDEEQPERTTPAT